MYAITSKVCGIGIKATGTSALGAKDIILEVLGVLEQMINRLQGLLHKP